MNGYELRCSIHKQTASAFELAIDRRIRDLDYLSRTAALGLDIHPTFWVEHTHGWSVFVSDEKMHELFPEVMDAHEKGFRRFRDYADSINEPYGGELYKQIEYRLETIRLYSPRKVKNFGIDVPPDPSYFSDPQVPGPSPDESLTGIRNRLDAYRHVYYMTNDSRAAVRAYATGNRWLEENARNVGNWR